MSPVQVVDVQLDGTTADQVKVSNTPGSRLTRGYLDISGCRHAGWSKFLCFSPEPIRTVGSLSSGAVYKPATVVNSPETCFSLTCDKDVILRTFCSEFW